MTKHLRPITLLIIMTLFACQENRRQESPTVHPEQPSGAFLDEMIYDISFTLTVANNGPGQPEKHNLWVALIENRPPYQEKLSQQISPDNYVISSDEYGNRYAEFDFQELQAGQNARVEITYQVAVRELAYDLADCLGSLPDMFNQPELHVESNNPQIIALAAHLADGRATSCDQARAFYDYIGSNLVYTYNGTDWGAQAALGAMGADCTEYSSLLMALSRASGIPARYAEGLLYLENDQSQTARTEHAWVELYLPGTGWVPVDPTLGRSPISRDKHFAKYTANHIILTNGRHPSTLRGASYYTHLYWPGTSANIQIQDAHWTIAPGR